MKQLRTFDEHKKWYIDAVRSHLIVKSGMTHAEASNILEKYNLVSRIEECPDIALHDDPLTIAHIIRIKYVK